MSDSADIWETASAKPIDSYPHPDRVSQVIFSSDGTELITACWDGKLRVWDITKKPDGPGIVFDHGGKIICAALSPDGRLLASLSSDGTARVWDLVHKRACTPPLFHSNTPYRQESGTVGIRPGSEGFVAFSSNGRHLAVVGWEGIALIWELAVSELASITPWMEEPRPFLLTPTIYQNTNIPTAADTLTSADGRWQAEKISSTSIQLWDKGRQEAFGPALEHSGDVHVVKFSPNDRYLVTAVGGMLAKTSGQVFVWDLVTGKTTELHLDHPGPVDNVFFSTDSRKLAIVMHSDYFLKGYGIWDKNVSEYTTGETRIWDLNTGEALTPAFNKGGLPKRVFFSPQSDRLIMAESKNVTIWDSESGAQITPKMTHEEEIYTIKIDYNRRRLLTSSADFTARVWNADSGVAITPPLRHPVTEQMGLMGKGVTLADFSPDGRLVVTACSGGLVRVWDTSTGQPVSPFWRHNSAIRGVDFSDEGTLVETKCADGTRYRWILRPEDRASTDLASITSLLARRRFDVSSTLEPLTAPEWRERFRPVRSEDAGRHEPTVNQVALWHNRMAVDSEVNHRPISAAFHLDQLVQYQPDDCSHHIRLAKVLASLNYFDASIRNHTRAIQLSPDNWKSWSYRADTFIQFERWDRAAEDFDKMIALHPNDLSLQADDALLHLAAGNMETCRYRLTQLVDIAATSASDDFPYRLVLDTLLAIPTAFQDARDGLLVEQLLNAQSQKGDIPNYAYLMGPVLYRQGNYQAAKEKIIEIYAKNKLLKDYRLQLFLTMLEARAGNREEALTWLKRSSQNFPTQILTWLKPDWQNKLIFNMLHSEALELLNS
jgi:WD40 repeat protein/tetratricopeptide (TPR) repeat protein